MKHPKSSLRRPLISCLLIFVSGVFSQSRSDSYKAKFNFPNALPGESLEIIKEFDSKTQQITLKSNSPKVNSAEDLIYLEQLEKESRAKKYGAINESLWSKLQNGDAAESLSVVIVLKMPAIALLLDKTRVSEERQRAQSELFLRISPLVSPESFSVMRKVPIKTKIGSNQLVCVLTRKNILDLAHDVNVAAVEEFPPISPAGSGDPDFNTLASSAYNHNSNPVPSSAGAGVNAATFESGLSQDFVNCLGIPPAQQSWLNITPAATTHSMSTFRCMFNAAPGANHYHTFSSGYSFSSDSLFLYNNTIRSTSASTARGEKTAWDATRYEFRQMDNFAYIYPYPVFVNPASNDGFQYIANWHCYNAICVGNVRHTNQSHWELVDTTNPSGGCTQTKNPIAIYGSVNDRELPHLVAPGYRPNGGQFSPASCASYFSDQLTACGTSWSAPIVNGLAADVMAANSAFLIWPEKVRVALLVTAQNVDRGYWSFTSDGRDGAGVVNGSSAVLYAQQAVPVAPNNTSALVGIGVGSIYATDFGNPAPIVFKIGIPSPKPSGKHLRVVLTWDSNPDMSTGSFSTNSLSDLDLLVTNGSSGTASQSYNSNVEMVDIPNSMFTAGSVVDARISKFINRIPTSGSSTNFFYYSIGWTWVADHAQ
jgi:hypothetical protein